MQRGRLRVTVNGLMFWCPGCDHAHGISTGPGGWGFNGDFERPTFTPSLLVRSGHYRDGWKAGDACWCTFYALPEHASDPRKFVCGICHSFVTLGRIQFLDDCTHHLKGQTVEIPMPEHFRDDPGI